MVKLAHPSIMSHVYWLSYLYAVRLRKLQENKYLLLIVLLGLQEYFNFVYPLDIRNNEELI